MRRKWTAVLLALILLAASCAGVACAGVHMGQCCMDSTCETCPVLYAFVSLFSGALVPAAHFWTAGRGAAPVFSMRPARPASVRRTPVTEKVLLLD